MESPDFQKKSTYTNYTLNHFSCIDHIITTQNIFDCILSNYIIMSCHEMSMS